MKVRIVEYEPFAQHELKRLLTGNKRDKYIAVCTD